MQYIKTIAIVIALSIATTLAWNYFLQVPPQFTQGVSQGYTQGYNDCGTQISENVKKNKVEGVFTPTTSGKFYLQVE